MADNRQCIAIIGGTGKLGKGLALRWAQAGYPILIGSRSLEKAITAVEDIRDKSPMAKLEGLTNAEAAKRADIAVLTVPFSHQLDTLKGIQDGLQGKILLDTTVPLRPPKVGKVQLPPEGSAAAAAQAFLGDNVRVVSAFHNVGAAHLYHLKPIDCDVLVTGNNVEARETVIKLAQDAGMRAFHAGPIANSAAAEAMTSVLIHINKRYKADHAGICITRTTLSD